MNRTKVIGTSKALELLKAGHTMRWVKGYTSRAIFTVGGQLYSVRYKSYLEIVNRNSPYRANLIVTRVREYGYSGNYMYRWKE